MKNKLKVLLSLLAICGVLSASTACGLFGNDSSETESSSSVESSSNIDGSSDESSSDESSSDESSSDESSSDESSSDESSSDESSSDESSSDETKESYTVTFMADGEEVEVVTYYEGDEEITAPAVPAKEGYDGVWEMYELGTENITVNAVYTAITYTISFNHPMTGMPLAAPIEFTVETKDSIVFPAPPADMAQEGYEVVWDKTEADITCADLQVLPMQKAIEYTVQFCHPMTGMPVAAPITYTVENMSEVVFPDIPADLQMEGYTVAWDKTPADLAIGGLTVSYIVTANTYKITYEANGGTCDTAEQEVTFGAEYTLATATPAKTYETFVGWVDEFGNAVEAGTWNIAADVTLTAVYTDVMTFENGVIPEAFTVADDGESLEIVEKDGSKVIQINNKNQAPAMKVTLEFLKQYFDDSSVDYLAFDAKADKENNNFRRDTNRDNALTAVTYEHDMTYDHDSDGDGTKEKYPTTGVRADAWKTFYFSRADYNFWVSQNLTAARFIATGGMTDKAKVYIDNIRPVTAAERKAGIGSFESAGIRINDAGKTLLFYTLDQGGTWQFNMQVGSGAFTNVGLTNANVTDGIAALTFTKPAGNLAFNFTSGRVFSDELTTSTGYYALDIYVPADADTTMSYHVTSWAGVTLKKGAWTTIYVNAKNQITITDTTGGTYALDNLRVISQAEYNKAALSMEANVSGLRTQELGDNTAHSGVCYYYGGADHVANRFSFAVGEGNGENDGAALKSVSLSSEQAHDGTYSLAIEKGAGYIYLTMRNDSTAYEVLKDGFTFWIYSTTAINGTESAKNFVNGANGLFNDGEGIVIPANTWTQVTVTAADMNPTRFLILQGSFEGTIYLDDFQPLN